MRFPRILLVAGLLVAASVLSAAPKLPSTEARVKMIEGTVMVVHVNSLGVTENLALSTTSTVSRGDIMTVYDKAWVILKSPKGDLIGLMGPAVAAFDELFKGGPDRQVRLLLKSGQAYIKSKNSGSRQSFFEVHTGPLVSTFGAAKAALEYDPKENRVEIRYFGGMLKTADAKKDRKYFMNSRRVWEKGAMTQEDPMPLPANAALNFRNFFDGKPKY